MYTIGQEVTWIILEYSALIVVLAFIIYETASLKTERRHHNEYHQVKEGTLIYRIVLLLLDNLLYREFLYLINTLFPVGQFEVLLQSQR